MIGVEPQAPTIEELKGLSASDRLALLDDILCFGTWVVRVKEDGTHERVPPEDWDAAGFGGKKK